MRSKSARENYLQTATFWWVVKLQCMHSNTWSYLLEETSILMKMMKQKIDQSLIMYWIDLWLRLHRARREITCNHSTWSIRWITCSYYQVNHTSLVSLHLLTCHLSLITNKKVTCQIDKEKLIHLRVSNKRLLRAVRVKNPTKSKNKKMRTMIINKIIQMINQWAMQIRAQVKKRTKK